MQKFFDYLSLMKPALISLILFVAIVSMVVATGRETPLAKLIEMFVLGFFALGGAAVLNNYYDRDIDAAMTRTSNRALPSGRISPKNAFLFGIILLILSITLIALLINILTAIIVSIGAFLYDWFYTIYLKRRTPSAVIWGGIAGSIPAFGGWSAVTNEHWLAPLFIFLIVFFWQPAHFWSLSAYLRKDFMNARIPAMPTLKDETEVGRQMLLYNSLVIPFTYLLYYFANLSVFYVYAATTLNALLILYTSLAYKLKRDNVYRANYRFSIVYMFMLLLAMVVARL
ncbi:protoheme IX farnesyltransferase [Candidatus Marsarchaeota G1 archaeon OSP_B]|jgi:protoheme IX farnesyltransferase|uniref:Protoheme IX farnesyltransferase n=3 Tax=Candidatus Marsarchaeota group 1 TaxID=2203770 RepID=A0A2R6AJT1_9ARCH|nr:MAG: protoheme IX farnesyltransferase [Candidatus Marsarchaeota G1 archaeon OSP_D]PSN86630.1 MAG: protoheme IX farnesyltransferase [Candidatus Marsarchaeota G1 archaeon BE_D]PSN94163.1 MAG: protoheme IX farnesyltransferase [Candidatus Marsarchaeota G1 archaeon OSP_B]